MRPNNSGVWPAENEPSWMDEMLPMDLRRNLLDKALDRIKAQRIAGHGHPQGQNQPEHPDGVTESSGHGK